MAIHQNTSIGSKSYEDNFDKIFGTKEERKVRHAKEAAEEAANFVKLEKAHKSAYINGAFTPFKSPVDGSIVSTRCQLKAHNKKHGVTDMRDYGGDWFKQRGEEMHNEKIGNTAQAKRERQEIVGNTLKQYGLIK